jgi:hypothetical protein
VSKAKPKAPEQPKRMGDVQPGDVAQTRAAWLLVTGQVWNGTLVELWDPEQERKVSATFGVSDDMPVLLVKPKKRTPLPPSAGGNGDYDPLRG